MIKAIVARQLASMQLRTKESVWWSPLVDDGKGGQAWRPLIPGLEERAFSQVVCSGAPKFSSRRAKGLRFKRAEDESAHCMAHYVVLTNAPAKGLPVHSANSEMSPIVHRLMPGDFVQAWVPRNDVRKLLAWHCTMHPVFHGWMHPYDDVGKACVQRVTESAVKVAYMVRALKRLSHYAHMHREHRVRLSQLLLSETAENRMDIQVRMVESPKLGRRRRSVQKRDPVDSMVPGLADLSLAVKAAHSPTRSKDAQHRSAKETSSSALTEVDARLALGADLNSLLEEMTSRALTGTTKSVETAPISVHPAKIHDDRNLLQKLTPPWIRLPDLGRSTSVNSSSLA